MLLVFTTKAKACLTKEGVMHLFKRAILAGLCAGLFPIASFAQITDMQSADYSKADLMSYWMTNDSESMRLAFENYSLPWGSYLLGLESGASRYTDLFQAFTADFVSRYGIAPNKADKNLLQEYYARRKSDYAGHLLLPTMALWHNYPMASIIPLANHLDAYWTNPDLAGDAYDFMADIDPEATPYYVGAHMGSFRGHPTNRYVLENFWNRWILREGSFAQADIDYLKQLMLEEILTHEAEYAVQELASSQTDLWPAIHVSPITQQNQSKIQSIISSYCSQTNFTTSCKTFVTYASDYGYITGIPQVTTTYTVIVDPILPVIRDPRYIVGYYWPVAYIRPLLWYHHPPVIRPRPRPHRPHIIHPGHGRPGGHKPGHPGGNPPPNGGGNHGGKPGHGGQGGHGDHGGHGGHGGQPGSNGGHGGQPGGNGGHGGQPGGNGGHGGQPGGNGGQPGGNGGHGGQPGGNGGNNGSTGSHGHITGNPRAERPIATERPATVTRMDVTAKRSFNRSALPSGEGNSSSAGHSNFTPGNRPSKGSSTHSIHQSKTVTPSHSSVTPNHSHGGNAGNYNRPATPSGRPSHNGNGAARSFGGSNRPSSGAGHSGSSFSSHGGAPSGSHSGGHGRHR